ncbi:MAG: flagellar hook protein FlgE [Magnetococcales bacterium]|nr:flagellar hook protein FlgE [Magnetococcales bacterium]
MSIMQAMYSGSSALINFGEAMTVIGNNLANANTTAFKASTSSFEDVLVQSVGTTGSGAQKQVGTGVGMADISQNMAQGSFISTSNVTDMSIDGKGFFMVRDPELTNQLDATGRPMDIFYTRAGSFRKDVKGDLVNSSGLVLQGWELDVDGNQKAGGTSGINLSTANTADPRATSRALVGVNLDSNTVANTATYSPADPSSFDFSTSVRVFDSRGRGHNVEIQFRKLDTTNAAAGDDNTWEWHAVTDEGDGLGLKAIDTDTTRVTAVPSGADYTAGILKFNSLGKLQNEGSTPLRFQFSGAEPQDILFDFGDALGSSTTVGGVTTQTAADSTNDFTKKTLDMTFDPLAATAAADTDNTGGEGSIQVSSGFATLRLSQDGFPSGFLDKLAINQDGIVSGSYSNGQTKQLFQIALVDFNDEVALEQAGSNLYKETVNSGLPRVGTAQSGRLGSIVSNSLEQSNVDMSAEFVRMITTQRGFQANSRIVSVTDGMLEELISLKR